jgi:peptidoglycan/xylan/chitin deacetylase (PgdA/CDA1 family)
MSTPADSGRDLLGYAGRPPKVEWPNGARLAVQLAVNFEEGAENSVEAGDPVAEQIGEVTTVVKPGVRDIGQEQLFAYGMRSGIWRMLDVFDHYAMPATFWMCGYAVQRVPQIARRVVEAGHEPAVHGWRWRPHCEFTDPQAERESIKRCLDVTEQATGVRPVGFFCRGSQSAYTRDLLIDLGFEYDSNAMDDDLPYWAKSSTGRAILAVPYAFDTNDMKFYHPNGFVTQDEFVGYVRHAIDALLDEGARSSPKMLTIAYHLRISGRPARIGALTRVLSYLQSLGDAVWVARRCDIARFWRSHF